MERRSRWTDLPGFRFHPTEEELLDFYLKRAVDGKKRVSDVIGTLNLYHHDPSELPGLAKMGEREWYFLVPRDKNRTHGRRLSRTTERGFWKVTGSDRPVRRASHPGQLIGLKKTLVFYKGRAPHGSRTDWVMNEYRLPGDAITPSSSPKEDVVLCKVYRKATSLKQQEWRAAMEECPTSAQHCVSPTAMHTGKLRGLPLVATERKPGEKEGEVTSVVLPGSKVAAEKLESGIVEASPCVGVDWPQMDPWWDQWFPLAVPMPSTSGGDMSSTTVM